MLELLQQGKNITVYLDGGSFGFIQMYDNPYHKRNCYIKLNLERLDPTISAVLFNKLMKIVNRPLQVMINSGDTQTAAFLTAGGFQCKRKCYEVEVYEKDLIGAAAQSSLLCAHPGEPEYDSCCKIMYEYYMKSHEAINPWTAEFTDFCEKLPAEVIYEINNGKIVNLAFVEDNEIAYIYTADRDSFGPFAASLIGWLFSSGHETICFESDDCDWAAMQLRAMFANQDEESFDTYVYKSERTIS